MQTIEFETDIINNTILIPENHQGLNIRHAKVIIQSLSTPKKKNSYFNPRDFFGVGNLSKQACDEYLINLRSGWN